MAVVLLPYLLISNLVKNNTSIFTATDHLIQVVVVGVPDARLGENMCACIVPKEGFHITADDMKQCFNKIHQTDEGLGMTPAYFMFLSSLPIKDANIDRKQLRKMAIEHFQL